MSLELKIIGWSSKGFRGPDYDLCLDPNNKVNLIQMPNGTGKTTTLELIKATLSGGAEFWGEEEIRGFAKKSNSDFYSPKGVFKINLSHNNEPLTFEIQLDFEEGNVIYRTTQSTRGIRNGFHPPDDLRRFLNDNFINLFVFDGELATALLDDNKTKAKEAIDSLFQLDLFDKLIKDLNARLNKIKEKSVAGKQGLVRRKNLRDKLFKRRNEIASLHEKRKKEFDDLTREHIRLDKIYNESLRKDEFIKKQLEEVDAQKLEIDGKLSQKMIDVKGKMILPQHLLIEFGEQLQELKANMDTLKLPESSSKEFFIELAEQEECVCGHKIDSSAKKLIIENSKNFLGTDEVAALNTIKGNISGICNNEPLEDIKKYNEILSGLELLVKQRDQLITKIFALEKEREKKGDTEHQRKKQEMEEVLEKKQKCEEALNEISRSPRPEDTEETDCLKSLDTMLKKADADLAQATNTVDQLDKTTSLVSLLKSAQHKCQEKIRNNIKDETNEFLKQALNREQVIVKSIDDSISLENQAGASMGQTLTVSYAFISKLFARENYQLPFIVDSPANSIDISVRRDVGKLIPKLCNQYIAFTISSEREGFVDKLDQASNGSISYITLFNKHVLTQELEESLTKTDIQTEQCVIAYGKDFFNSFDIEKEE